MSPRRAVRSLPYPAFESTDNKSPKTSRTPYLFSIQLYESVGSIAAGVSLGSQLAWQSRSIVEKDGQFLPFQPKEPAERSLKMAARRQMALTGIALGPLPLFLTIKEGENRFFPYVLFLRSPLTSLETLCWV